MNYDHKNWKLISDFLNSDRYADISVLNRALLLDDALNLARVGLLHYQVALNVTNYLRRESHYLPWKAALGNLDYIAHMLRLTDGLPGYKVGRRCVAAKYSTNHCDFSKQKTVSA